MDKTDNRKPATPEQIESIKTNLKLTIESSYHELYVDMVLLEALSQGMMDVIAILYKEYVRKVIRVHANVCYANLCLCVQLRASLKAELGVEKLPTVKQLNEEYAELLARKKEAYREYRKAKQEMTDFATAKYDIERFLNLEKEEETRAREKAKTKEERL